MKYQNICSNNRVLEDYKAPEIFSLLPQFMSMNLKQFPFGALASSLFLKEPVVVPIDAIATEVENREHSVK